MIEKLQSIEKEQIIALLKDPTAWQTLDINYHPPRVERLWTQLGKERLFLHKIYPCKKEEALYHPHEWESAIHILKGQYEMGLAVQNPFNEDEDISETQISRLILPAGSYYEMLLPLGWHYVMPIEKPSYSVMLISEKKWTQEYGKQIDPSVKLLPLSENIKGQLLKEFLDLYLPF